MVTPTTLEAATAPEAAPDDRTKTPRAPLPFHWVAPLVGAYLGAWMVRRMWGPALIGGADSTAIAIRTDRTIRDVLAHGHLNGWSPYFSIGHEHVPDQSTRFHRRHRRHSRGFLRPTVNRGRHQGGGAAVLHAATDRCRVVCPVVRCRSFALLRSPASCPSPFRCSPASASVAFSRPACIPSRSPRRCSSSRWRPL